MNVLVNISEKPIGCANYQSEGGGRKSTSRDWNTKQSLVERSLANWLLGCLAFGEICHTQF